MEKLSELTKEFERKSEERFKSFEIESVVNDLSKIQDDAYLETSKWLGGDEKFVCLGIDLDKSSALSARKSAVTMAKLYEYFTQNIVDIMNIEDICADYIDIKGDGVFGIYQGDDSIERAFVAAVTFRTFFEKVIKPKFGELSVDLKCKSAICKDKILVKKIGTRKYKNEVWAGKLVNNTYKIMAISKKIKETFKKREKDSLLIVSSEIKTYLNDNYKKYAILSCGCGSSDSRPVNLWYPFDVSDDEDVAGEKVFYLPSIWCDIHGDEYLAGILGLI